MSILNKNIKVLEELNWIFAIQEKVMVQVKMQCRVYLYF